MAHYKNRRPKTFKGHCGMCTLQTTDGRRNGRIRTKQEKLAALSEKEQRRETGR